MSREQRRSSLAGVPVVYTPAEAAEVARVSRRTLYEWIRTGLLPATRTGPRLLVVRSADLEQFLGGRGELVSPAPAQQPAAAVVQSKQAGGASRPAPAGLGGGLSSGKAPAPPLSPAAKPAKKRRH